MERKNIVIRDGVIASLEAPSPPHQGGVDGEGLLAFPGGIDVHVHFRDPGAPHKEDWESGSRAALAGGITSVMDMPNTSPPTTTLEDLEEKRRRAAGKSRVHYGLAFGLTNDNEAQAAVADCLALKAYLGESTGSLLLEDDRVLRSILEAPGPPLVVHAEDQRTLERREMDLGKGSEALDHGKIRDESVALAALMRVIHCMTRRGRSVHVAHISTAREVEALLRAKRNGLPLSCEVTPHHLFLDVRYVAERGCLGKVNPPLRSPATRALMWRHTQEGHLDMVASDHAPHPLAEKEQLYPEAPAGLPGVELTLPLLVNAAVDDALCFEHVTQLLGEGPARAFGLSGKGRLEPGYDADIVLVDPETPRRVLREALHSRAGWSPYEGRELRGWPVRTLLAGHLAYDRGAFDDSIRGQELLSAFP